VSSDVSTRLKLFEPEAEHATFVDVNEAGLSAATRSTRNP
jgi:hypothetical protein